MLTGLMNRNKYNVDVAESYNRELNNIGVVFLDLDRLKDINDNFGHHMGDAMLMASAKLIENAFADLEADCFRIGGDEFAVLLSGDNVDKRCESALDKFKALMNGRNKVSTEDLVAVLNSFIPPNYPLEIELQNLVALQECTSRDLLPENMRELDRNAVTQRIRELKALMAER